MNKKISKIISSYPIRTMLITLIAIMALSAVGCALFPSSPKPTPEPVLSETQQKILNTICNNRSVWETSPIGEECTRIKLHRYNSNVILTCAYSGSGDDEAMMSYTYLVDYENDFIRRANYDEDGGRQVGLVTGLYSYNTAASETAKHAVIKKMVANFGR